MTYLVRIRHRSGHVVTVQTNAPNGAAAILNIIWQGEPDVVSVVARPVNATTGDASCSSAT